MTMFAFIRRLFRVKAVRKEAQRIRAFLRMGWADRGPLCDKDVALIHEHARRNTALSRRLCARHRAEAAAMLREVTELNRRAGLHWCLHKPSWFPMSSRIPYRGALPTVPPPVHLDGHKPFTGYAALLKDVDPIKVMKQQPTGTGFDYEAELPPVGYTTPDRCTTPVKPT